MAKVVEPKVFVIAETCIVQNGLDAFLGALGVPEWESNASSAAELLTEVAGKSCYLSFSTDLNKNLTRANTRSNHEYIQEQIVGTKHGSVLEHSTMTFALLDVSRVLTHELVRHRAGTAFSQVSGRYVRTDKIGYFLPSVIANNPEASQMMEDAFRVQEGLLSNLEKVFGIDEMKDMKLKKTLTSAFRRLIGNGQANHIIFTANHRTLRNIIQLRTHESAEEEIRHVFAEIFRLCALRHPAIYADARTELLDGINKVTFPGGHV